MMKRSSGLTHVVVFTLHSGVTRQDERAKHAAAISAGHPLHIEQIQTWSCGWDCSGREDAADFVVVGTFATPEDFAVFQSHPDHQRGKDAWAKIATWMVAEITGDDGASRE